jgi:hypothetical protein
MDRGAVHWRTMDRGTIGRATDRRTIDGRAVNGRTMGRTATCVTLCAAAVNLSLNL